MSDQNRAILPTVTRPARPTSVRLATIARCLVLLSVLAVIAACYLAQDIISSIMLALLFSLLFSPLAGLLQRLHLPRALASGLIVLAIVAASVGALYALTQPAKEWIAKAPAAIHSVSQRFKEWRGPVQQAQKATESLNDLTGAPTANTQQVIVKDTNPLAALAAGTPRVLESIAATILLVYFFLSSGDNFLRRLVEIAPGMTEKKIVVSIARDIQKEMSRYLQTITIINLGLGCATALAMALLGVPNALLWGAMVFLFNFAPYIGATVSAIVLATVGFSTFYDSIGHALAVPGTFLCLAFIEGQLVTPTVIGRRLAVNPVVVFVWLLVWGWLWGLIGILLAGPLLACFRIICQHTEALRPIYVLIGEAKFDEVEQPATADTTDLDVEADVVSK